MLHRALNPLGTMQSATSSGAQLGGLLPTAETIPALGFARVTGSHGPIPAARQHTMQGPSNGPNVSRSYTAQPQHQPYAVQPSTSPPSSSRRPHAGFTTASRASNARPPARSSSRMAADEPTRHYPWALSSSDAAPPPSHSFVVASNKDTRTNEQGPPVIQYGANIYSSPPNAHVPAVQLSPPPNVHPAHVSQNLGNTPASRLPPASSPGNITSLHPTNTMTTLSPPAISRKRSPSPLKLDDAATRSRTTPVPREPSRNSRTPEQRQAVFVDSPIDYYSSLGSQVAALPPQSATFASGPLVAVVPTPVKPEFEEPQIRMCVVCFDQEPDVRFAARCPTAGCQHGASVCVNCLERHILIAIHHSRTVDIKCPHSGCGKTLDYQDVYSSVRDWGQLVYYEQLLLRQEMGNNEDFVWCKNPLCRSGQVHKGGRHQPIVMCKTCHQKSCFVHDRPWHEGMTCQEFDQKLRKNVEQDTATRKYLVENTKPCPKCKRNIERNGGCDHMVCRPPGGCGHEFCWECFADGSRHKPECSNYTAVSRGRRPRRRTHLAERPYVPAA